MSFHADHRFRPVRLTAHVIIRPRCLEFDIAFCGVDADAAAGRPVIAV